MNRIKSLNRYQKGILILMIVMPLTFAVIYLITIQRVGFEYKDTILVPSQEKDKTVYSGKIHGQQAYFTISEDKTVVFRHGNTTYGPYTAKEDPTVIPKEEEMAEYMTGVELRQGEYVLFRGGILETKDFYLLYNEDGVLSDLDISVVISGGEELDENGNQIDPMEPSAATILKLMNDPKLTHKGEGFAWLGATLICAFNMLSVLFADELFHWYLSFQIRYAYDAEPSDFEIAGRYIGWTTLSIAALILFIMGLQ